MKDNEKTQKLIDELKALADNDFERHRIDVLERDLTEPPKVEIIDEKTQKFNGVIYYKRDCGHYRGNAHIHRVVYTYFFGDIPTGYDIHHIDENKANNDISNLIMVTRLEHHKIHGPQSNISGLKIKEQYTCQNCGKKYEGYRRGHNLYCSDQCRREANSKKNLKNCIICGMSFYARKKNQSCCSQECSQKNALQQQPLLIKKCPFCGMFTKLSQ